MGDLTQTFVGNGKKVQVTTNTGLLRIIGNNCFATVTKNEGHIVITGNKGHLQVSQNTGNISYTGNNGLIEVGSTSKGIGQVVYTGNGGVVRKMKTSGSSGRCSSRKSSTKNSTTHEPKTEGSTKPKKEVHSELRVNGVEVCINPKLKSATKESAVGQKKLKRTATAPATSCCQQARNILWPNSSSTAEPNASLIKVSSTGSIELVNVNNFELENFYLNLATELVAL